MPIVWKYFSNTDFLLIYEKNIFLYSKNIGRGLTSTGTRMNLKKRSPSPVVTGKVSSYRNKFESSSPTSPGPTLPRYRKYDFKCRRSTAVFYIQFFELQVLLRINFIKTVGSIIQNIISGFRSGSRSLNS